ncbi:hypothetical protein AC578_3247 [Pseudocercospora eumusae]|uniref:F-box domain-containing protein n=1 Tax=Pseudocercospora eumusae TaxID=321146 RepID=A0A139H1V0_9PEZI|nr:hypothetical protein AC578_3247 [Pseudocercospora eumusae]
MATHTSRAFQTVELLAMILSLLTPQELKQAYRVDRTFKSTIDQDQNLRRRVQFFNKSLRLDQAFDDHKTGLSRRFGQFETTLHPILHRQISPAKQGCPLFFYVQVGKIWDLQTYHSAKMSQIVCQPHTPCIKISFNKTPWASEWQEEIVWEVEEGLGVTLGQLVDAVKRLKVLWTQEVRVELVQRGRESTEYQQEIRLEISREHRNGRVMKF